MRKFETDMRKLPRIDTRCGVEEKTFWPKTLLIYYAADNNLEEIVEDGEWTTEYGKLIVDALIAGSTSFKFRRNVKTSVEYARVVDESDRARL